MNTFLLRTSLTSFLARVLNALNQASGFTFLAFFTFNGHFFSFALLVASPASVAVTGFYDLFLLVLGAGLLEVASGALVAFSTTLFRCIMTNFQLRNVLYLLLRLLHFLRILLPGRLNPHTLQTLIIIIIFIIILRIVILLTLILLIVVFLVELVPVG
jgi:hypothetical protein